MASWFGRGADQWDQSAWEAWDRPADHAQAVAEAMAAALRVIEPRLGGFVEDGPTLDALTYIGCFFPLIFLASLHYTRFAFAKAFRAHRHRLFQQGRAPATNTAERQRECADILFDFHADPANLAPLVEGRFFNDPQRRVNPSLERLIDLGSLATGARMLCDLFRVQRLDDGGQAQQERNQRMGNPAFEEEVLFEFSCVDHTELKYQGCVYMAVAGVYEFRFTGALGARKITVVRTGPGVGHLYVGGAKSKLGRDGTKLKTLPEGTRWHTWSCVDGRRTGEATTPVCAAARVMVVTRDIEYKATNQKWTEQEAWTPSNIEQFLIFALSATVGYDACHSDVLGWSADAVMRNTSIYSFFRHKQLCFKPLPPAASMEVQRAAFFIEKIEFGHTVGRARLPNAGGVDDLADDEPNAGGADDLNVANRQPINRLIVVGTAPPPRAQQPDGRAHVQNFDGSHTLRAEIGPPGLRWAAMGQVLEFREGVFFFNEHPDLVCPTQIQLRNLVRDPEKQSVAEDEGEIMLSDQRGTTAAWAAPISASPASAAAAAAVGEATVEETAVVETAGGEHGGEVPRSVWKLGLSDLLEAADRAEHQAKALAPCGHILVVMGFRQSINLGVHQDAEEVSQSYLLRCCVPEVIMLGGAPMIKLQAPDPAMAKYGSNPKDSMLFIRQLYRLLDIIAKQVSTANWLPLVDAETVVEGMIETLKNECDMIKRHPLYKVLTGASGPLAKLHALRAGGKKPSTVSLKPLDEEQRRTAEEHLSSLVTTASDEPPVDNLWRDAFEDQINQGTSANYFLRAVALAQRVWPLWCQSVPHRQVMMVKVVLEMGTKLNLNPYGGGLWTQREVDLHLALKDEVGNNWALLSKLSELSSMPDRSAKALERKIKTVSVAERAPPAADVEKEAKRLLETGSAHGLKIKRVEIKPRTGVSLHRPWTQREVDLHLALKDEVGNNWALLSKLSELSSMPDRSAGALERKIKTVSVAERAPPAADVEEEAKRLLETGSAHGLKIKPRTGVSLPRPYTQREVDLPKRKRDGGQQQPRPLFRDTASEAAMSTATATPAAPSPPPAIIQWGAKRPRTAALAPVVTATAAPVEPVVPVATAPPRTAVDFAAATTSADPYWTALPDSIVCGDGAAAPTASTPANTSVQRRRAPKVFR